MSAARQDILRQVRSSLRRTDPLDPTIALALEERLKARQIHPRPSFSADLVQHFVSKVKEVGGTIERVKALTDAPAAVGKHLSMYSLPSQLVLSGDTVIGQIEWPASWSVEMRAAGGNDPVAVTGALVAVAETGTLVLVSGPETPTTLRFLPDDHIVIITAEQIVPHLEDAWLELRRQFTRIPRAVNLISGPSKTADVEQTLQVGAHGPRRLHVVLIQP